MQSTSGQPQDEGVVAHWKAAPSRHARGPAAVSAESAPGGSEELLSSLCFLQRMATVFEEQGNYAECVKSVESALLLRQGNVAAVEAALKARQHALANPTPRQRAFQARHGVHADLSADGDYVPLTDEGDVVLPWALSRQAQDVVLRCNSYAVEALQHAQFDGAAFFLNRAMFLTDGDEDTRLPGAEELARAAATTTTDGVSPGASGKSGGVVSGQWWWRTVLQPPAVSPALAGGPGEVDALVETHEDVKRTTAATAAALRACFEPTPHDQQLRLSLRAATLNHLGCLEQRRGRLRAAVVFFRMAIRAQAQLDEARRIDGDAVAEAARRRLAHAAAAASLSPTTSLAVASPSPAAAAALAGTGSSITGIASTYMNLGTALNELGQHAEAAQVYERVLPLLQQSLLECATARTTLTAAATASEVRAHQFEQQAARAGQTRVATMLAVAYYSLGATLERRDAESRIAPASRWAFDQAVEVCNRYRLVPSSCRTVEEVMYALRHPGAKGNAAAQPPSPQQEPQQQLLHAAPPAVDAPMQSTNAVSTAAPSRSAPPPPPMNPSSWGASASSPLVWQADMARPAPAAESRATAMGAVPVGGAAPVQVGAKRPQPPQQSVLAQGAPRPRPSSHNQSAARPPLPPPPPAASASVPALPGMVGLPPQPAWQSPFSPADRRSPPPVLEPLPTTAAAAGASGFAATAPTAVAQRPPTLAKMPSPPLPPAPRRSLPSAGSSTLHDGAMPSAPALPAPPAVGSGGGAAVGSNTPLGRRMLGATAPTGAVSASVSQTPAPAHPRPSIAGMSSGLLPRASLRASLSAVGSTTAAAAVAAAAAGGGGTVSSTPRNPAARGGSGGRLNGMMGDRQRNLQNAKSQQTKRQKSLVRRQQIEAAVADAALAEKVFHQLISDKEKGEVERRRRAAVEIQRMWRGVLARSWVATLIKAAVRLQRVVRRFLVHARVRRAVEAEELARRMAEVRARQEAACRVLQARARQFLRRLQIRREYRARQARYYYAARTIQRGYRAFCQRRAAFLATRAEVHRREDEQRQFRRKIAARRIQRAYLEYRTKRAELDEHNARQRRVRAAIHIQAVVRGYLARAWYAYYRVYRRDQEVRSAAMQSRLVLIQSACRAICSAYYGQQRALEALLAMRESRRDQAATRLQCLWRCHVAKIRCERLQAEHQRRMRHATRVQRWYRMRVQRRAFLVYRAEQQRIRAASRLQRWLRACWQAAKARAFAAYHSELLRQQQLQRLQARAILILQAGCAACVSDRLVASVRRTFQRSDMVARVCQRVARGYAGRKEMALEQRAAYWVAMREREEARRTAAASVVQRAWRCAAARELVQRGRREVAAAGVVARAYRVHRARVQLGELREARRLRLEDAAARRIQRALRGFLHRQRAKEMDAYYRGEHRKKMGRLRRQEAAVMIQTLWRGHVTRRVVAEEREAWQELSAAASRIQRTWRARVSRRQLLRELDSRIKERGRDADAALVVQCFWRKTLAARCAAQLRQQAQQRLAAVLQVQRWWRMKLAQRAFARRRVIRREEAALELYYAMLWETNVSRVNAFVRTRQAQVLARDQLRDRLVQQLTAEERHRFMSRNGAATKIQAAYRGRYERMYVRGVLAEARAAARQAAELAARQQRAATTIQCAWRSARARQQLADLKQAELERVLVSHQELAEKADPAEVVRELFWLNTTYQQREAGNARLRETERRRAAAAVIQRAYRCYRSQQHLAAAAKGHQREHAARLLQDYWRHYRDNHRIKERQRRQLAATQLQSHIRGWLVRRSWPLWRATAEAERQEHVLVQDVLDHAAIVIQCFWRRVEAERTAARLRQAHQERHRERATQEAATFIQETFRESQRRRLARTL